MSPCGISHSPRCFSPSSGGKLFWAFRQIHSSTHKNLEINNITVVLSLSFTGRAREIFPFNIIPLNSTKLVALSAVSIFKNFTLGAREIERKRYTQIAQANFPLLVFIT